MRQPLAAGIAGLALAAWAVAAAPAAIPLGLATTMPSTNQPAARARPRAELALRFPLPSEVYLTPPGSRQWLDAKSVEGTVVWPAAAPARAQLLVFMKDRDGRWFQQLRPAPLATGTNHWSFDFTAEAVDWTPVGHHQAWNYRTRLEPQLVGLRVFALQAAYTGACEVADVSLVPAAPPQGPPFIRQVRPNTLSVPCNGLFELQFDLPDRYANPFDPAVVDAALRVETPDGQTHTVAAFYMQDFFRVVDDVGESLVPQGRPAWRARYAPRLPGTYRYTLTVKDGQGQAATAPATFEARLPGQVGFVRRSAADPRHFELDDGTFFFPIGHNVRSPFDTRMDEQFPWRFRHPEGTGAYRRYFRSMSEAGENLAEIWMCQWSLGLEWSTVSPGYHGSGDYHLGNAWELDEVLRWARESRLRINLVLNNHGRVGLGYDAEWNDHPYNQAQGGFIAADDPLAFFADPRALALQKQLARYIVARWGWDASIFAWELWSELDLVGKHGQQPVPQKDPRVIAWHRLMGDTLRELDLGRHLITTHLSGDYRITSPELAQLPQLDHCGIDAYHFNHDPLHIVNLIRETAEHYKAYNKPVLITEFGGSSMGAGVNHLTRELHAALWASVCVPLGGTPLFWWWQVVEEQNLYPMYTAVARFMADVDRRDPALVPVRLSLAFDEHTPIPPAEADHLALASPTQALAWVFIRSAFARFGAPLETPLEHVTATWTGCSNAIYRAAFYDTATGAIIKQQDQRGANGRLTLRLPPLARDMALKIRLVEPHAAAPSPTPP